MEYRNQEGALHNRGKGTEDAGNAWFESAPDIIAIIGFDGFIRRVNAAAAAVSGYAREELAGAHLCQFIHPDDVAIVNFSRRALAAGRRGWVIGLRGITRDGEVCWLEWNAASLDNESFVAIGRVYESLMSTETKRHVRRSLAFGSDRRYRLRVPAAVKPHRQTVISNFRERLSDDIAGLADIDPFEALTAQLSRAEQRAHRVVDLSFDIILRIDGKHLLIEEVNVRGAAMLGGHPGDFIGRSLLEIVSPHERELVAKRVVDALHTGELNTVSERRLLRLDGAVLEMEGVTIPALFRGVPAAYAVYRDISLRKAAERASHQREHHFETLAKAAPVGIFQTDINGLCAYVNERYLAITGYSLPELLGKSFGSHVVPEDVTEFYSLWAQLGEEHPFRAEYRIRRKDGQVIWVLGQAVAERGSEGEILGCIGSITDITRNKLNEIELRNYREHLEEMVQERTLELEAVNRELESFSYSVSHDLRAPLRAIHGFNAALIDEYSDKLDDSARFYLRRIQANSRQMSELIEDLLELSKVTQAELKREWVDLSALAAGIVDELRLMAPKRRVDVEIAPGLRAFGDPKLLHSLLQNLFGNAWKYSSRREAAYIGFGAVENGTARTFFVRDNGVGFDMSCASDLFRAFQRLHHPSEFEGTGIGLATVHRIVTRHGGKVWAEAAEGEGATFFFILH